MSAITAPIIARTARNRLGWSANEMPRLRAMIPTALKRLGIRVARRADCEALRKEIAITVVAGVITLTDTSILAEVLLETGELIVDSKFAKPAPSYQELTLRMPTDVYRWSLKTPTKIHVTDLTTGALGTVAKTGTLAFNYWPTLTEMPDAYDPELIDIVVELAGGKVEEPTAPKLEKEDSGVKVDLKT